MAGETVEVYGHVKATTDDAYLIYDGDVSAWVPRSKILNIDIDDDDCCLMTIPEWLAIAKEFI